MSGAPTAIVGREHELEELEAALDAVAGRSPVRLEICGVRLAASARVEAARAMERAAGAA